MIWKVIPQIITVVVLMVIAILDYKCFDKRTKEFKIFRRILFLLLVAFLVVSVIQVTKSEKEQQEIARKTVTRLVEHASQELSENFSVIQIKGGLSSGVTLPRDETELRYELSIIGIPKFSTMVPKVWGQEFKMLLDFGKEGKGVYQAVLDVYDSIEKTEKNEREILSLIEKERRPHARSSLLKSLHLDYDKLRRHLMIEAKTLNVLKGKLGKT